MLINRANAASWFKSCSAPFQPFSGQLGAIPLWLQVLGTAKFAAYAFVESEAAAGEVGCCSHIRWCCCWGSAGVLPLEYLQHGVRWNLGLHHRIGLVWAAGGCNWDSRCIWWMPQLKGQQSRLAELRAKARSVVNCSSSAQLMSSSWTVAWETASLGGCRRDKCWDSDIEWL